MKLLLRLIPLLFLVACSTVPPKKPPPPSNQNASLARQKIGMWKQVELPGTQSPKTVLPIPLPTSSNPVNLKATPTDIWDRLRQGFAIPNLDTPLTQQWTNYYGSHLLSVQHMAQRAGKYLYYILEEINQRGLPTELALLPFVESAYDPNAVSNSQALGLWQFAYTTGKHYHLRQNSWYDERRDLIASTRAALEYLEYLYNIHGDWHLALAAYNWGEGALRRAIEKNRMLGLPTDYSALSLPSETLQYFPKLQAIKNILSNPQNFALALPKVNNQAYFQRVKKNYDIDTELAAKLAEISLDELKALNPTLQRPLIQAKQSLYLLLPTEKVHVFNANLATYKGKLSSWKTHHVRRGESYAKIAKHFNFSEARLRQINELGSKKKALMAQTLFVPNVAYSHLVKLNKKVYTGKINRSAIRTTKQYHAWPKSLQTADNLKRGGLKVSRALSTAIFNEDS